MFLDTRIVGMVAPGARLAEVGSDGRCSSHLRVQGKQRLLRTSKSAGSLAVGGKGLVDHQPVGGLAFLTQSKEASVSTSTVTSKGQITLPRDVRQALGLDAGD